MAHAWHTNKLTTSFFGTAKVSLTSPRHTNDKQKNLTRVFTEQQWSHRADHGTRMNLPLAFPEQQRSLSPAHSTSCLYNFLVCTERCALHNPGWRQMPRLTSCRMCVAQVCVYTYVYMYAQSASPDWLQRHADVLFHRSDCSRVCVRARNILPFS